MQQSQVTCDYLNLKSELSKIKISELGMVVHIGNLSNGESEAGGLL